MAKVTIFGLAGTGKSTVSALLASKTGYALLSAGSLARQYAKDHGQSVYEYNALAAADPSIDKALDTYIESYGKEHNGFIFESWLGWYFIPDSFKVKLACDEAVRMARIAGREHLAIDDAAEKTLEREKSKKERFRRYYGLEVFPPADELFDLVIDTSNVTPEEIVRHIYGELLR
jgi:cytidylate kinase